MVGSVGAGSIGLPAPLPCPAPAHFPFAGAPADPDVLFEALLAGYAAAGAALQYLHLYRSVWWLPHSYTKDAINFYLIDEYLVIFIAVVLARRFIYVLGCRILDKTVSFSVTGENDYTYFRTLLVILISVMLSICACFVIQNHSKVTVLYLCYPAGVYLLIFGRRAEPLLGPAGNGARVGAMHACGAGAEAARAEAAALRHDFNGRVRRALFAAVANAYYAGFVPCCFAQSSLRYDVGWAAQHVVFVFAGSLAYALAHVLSPRYCDALHRCALHLGAWKRLDSTEANTTATVVYEWRDDYIWPSGSLVRHEGVVWRALGDCNASRPGDKGLDKFYKTFILPSYRLGQYLAVHLSVVLYQLYLLFFVMHWYKVVSLAFQLFFNYYVLYKIFRDYLVCHKVYREEKDLRTKIDYR